MTDVSNIPPVGSTLEFEVVSHVTKPTFQFPEDGTPVFFQVTSPIALLPEVQRTRRRAQSDPTKQTMPDPKYMDVTNLATGEIGRALVPAVIESSLTDSYPDDGYIGRSFRFRKQGKVKGQRGFTYNAFEILEIKLKVSDSPATGTLGKKVGK